MLRHMDKRSATILVVVGALLILPSAYALLTMQSSGSWDVALQTIAIALLALPLVGLGLIVWGVFHLVRKAPITARD
jgi:hypothetical protein